MIKQLKKYLASVLCAGLVLAQVTPAIAIELPTPQPVPEAPSAPSAPTAPTAPEAPSAPSAPSAPGNMPDPTPEATETPRPTKTPNPTPTESAKQQASQAEEPAADALGFESTAANPDSSTETGGQSMDGAPDPFITTGDATTTGVGITEANTNLGEGLSSAVLGQADSTVINSGNGAGSSNNGSIGVSDTSETIQTNTANVTSGMSLESNTGNNSTSKNLGDSTIETGDANTSGTLITAVNTNVDGVMVAEFNVVDDQVGDLVLDFAANCVSGCATGDLTVKNQGNGANSENNGSIDSTSDNSTFQTNDATVANTMFLEADSGNNTADKNTGGDSNITTGDANVSASAVTFANNNIAGNVILGYVNIYGDLTGDIIFPEEMLENCCGAAATAANIKNGAGSGNVADVSQQSTDLTYQYNTAVIDNVLILDANTGANDANKNTGGNSAITTGDSSVNAQVLNVANTNIDGGNMWLVIVNEAGKWIGKLLGSPDGSNFAASEGTEFQVGENGEVTAVNGGNGAESQNSATINQTNTNTTVQTNTALVTNTLDLSANTGKNSTSKNTNGDNSIETGDATIVANIVNFVNNNISGGGKLFVTVINVFGNWLGDFVAPGTQKEAAAIANSANTPPPGVGGSEVSTGNNSTISPTPVVSYGPENNVRDNEEADVTPTPTNKPQRVFATTTGIGSTGDGGAVLPAATFSSGDNNIANDVEVTPTPAVAGKKVLTINLAWLLILIPCAIIALAIRKIARSYLLPRKLSPAV